jgi:hypothetical protein
MGSISSSLLLALMCAYSFGGDQKHENALRRAPDRAKTAHRLNQAICAQSHYVNVISNFSNKLQSVFAIETLQTIIGASLSKDSSTLHSHCGEDCSVNAYTWMD